MRILVIPDVHQKLDKLSLILENNTFDTLISLGDWFDDFYDTPEHTERTAKYILKLYSQFGENFIWLLGNHDIPYLYPAAYDRYACSGNTREKLKVVGRVLEGSKPLGFSPKLSHVVKIDGCLDFVLSHAGVTEHHFGEPLNKEISSDSVAQRCSIAEERLDMGLEDPVLNAGFARGGGERIGGITWADWFYEFGPIRSLSQIVGHTPLKRPEVVDGFSTRIAPDEELASLDRYIPKPDKSYNINIDTHLENYLTIENNEILIHKTSKLK